VSGGDRTAAIIVDLSAASIRPEPAPGPGKRKKKRPGSVIGGVIVIRSGAGLDSHRFYGPQAAHHVRAICVRCWKSVISAPPVVQIDEPGPDRPPGRTERGDLDLRAAASPRLLV